MDRSQKNTEGRGESWQWVRLMQVPIISLSDSRATRELHLLIAVPRVLAERDRGLT